MVYKTRGTCSTEIHFDVEDNKVKNVKFMGGCHGNLQAVSKLCEGQDINTLIEKLDGIVCRFGTSCPDQLARALKKYKEENNK